MNKELLVPVGSMDCLYQAIHNGADAVYLGCKSFGARKFATNFTNDEIKEAIKTCHLYGVKIYVTMNTLVKDNEVEDFINQAEFLHNNGVDALIVQDFGMICLLRETFPNLEIHASTQANTSSYETCKLFHDMGIKRVVFSREMSLEEIESINIPIEKEVFIHGALCISYSGCCLMSSMIGGRSGNRGECAGSCRLPYNLEQNNKIISKNKYLISTKELNTSTVFDKLLNSSIKSFKIEGRMKSPEYVGFITKFYRQLMDNEDIDIEEYNNKLKTIFNREFTLGHLFNTKEKELLNTKSPNHIGLEIGKVIETTKDKIKIKLTRPLNQQDGIRFLNDKSGFIVNFLYDKKGNMINSANDICYVDNKVNLQNNDIVMKTLDYKLMNELKNYDPKKIKINIDLTCQKNRPLTLIISDKINTVKVVGQKVEQSINAPMTEERIIKQINKLGETPFISNKINILMDDDIFISVKELNELRRSATTKLMELRRELKKEVIKNKVEFKTSKYQPTKGLAASVFNEEQLKACLSLGLNRIYVKSKELYEKYKENYNIFYMLPRCVRNINNEIEDNIISNEYFEFNNKEVLGDYGLNVYNSYTIYYLNRLGVNLVNASVELTEDEIINMKKSYENNFKVIPNIEVMVYGRVENMIIKGNILNIEKNNYSYNLVDLRERKFPVYFDGVNTHILNYCNKEEINYKENIRFDFYKETKDEIIKIINSYI